MRLLSRLALILPAALLASFLLPSFSIAHADEMGADCIPTGASSSSMTEGWMALPSGASETYVCTASIGVTYRFDLMYDGAGRLPGDAGNYIAIESYHLNHVAEPYAERHSDPNGFNRETLARTADMDEMWYVKVTNTANNGAYDTEFQLSAHVIGGQVD